MKLLPLTGTTLALAGRTRSLTEKRCQRRAAAVDCADAQRELIAFHSEAERGGGETPVRFGISHCETRTGNAPAVLCVVVAKEGR